MRRYRGAPNRCGEAKDARHAEKKRSFRSGQKKHTVQADNLTHLDLVAEVLFAAKKRERCNMNIACQQNQRQQLGHKTTTTTGGFGWRSGNLKVGRSSEA